MIHAMSKQDQILQEFLVRSLNQPLSEGLETAIASESALRKIWLTPEEDEAWADL